MRLHAAQEGAAATAARLDAVEGTLRSHAADAAELRVAMEGLQAAGGAAAIERVATIVAAELAAGGPFGAGSAEPLGDARPLAPREQGGPAEPGRAAVAAALST